ncbi:MAG: tetratricopeptide repeat protein [Acidobacteria bacterium]|nr:tetratricopeptide repeat protein [Acidobacteriota bacterium]
MRPFALIALLFIAPVAARAQESTAHADSTVTFTRHVAPLIFDRCASCHRPGGAAPFSLLSYDDVRRRATLVAQVTKHRFMPPWKADAGNGAFVGQRHLSEAEVETIQEWVVAGMPEGDARDLPPTPTWSDGWHLGTPDLIVTLPEPFVLPASPADVFRIFALPLPVDRLRYVRGIEFHPGNPRVVHHANMRLDRTSSTRDLDAADPLPGYEGLMPRSAQYPDGHFLGWTPGQIAPPVDGSLAWPLRPDTDLIIELHMQPSGATERVQPSVGLYFSDRTPSRTPSILRLGSQGIDIPAGNPRYPIGDAYTLPVDVQLLAIQPHAHYRAREVEGTATLPDGSTRTLLRIGDWDFRWQHVFRYVEPVSLPRGTKLSMRYTYDNSAENPRNPRQPPTRVLWGQRSGDEMGDLWFQVLAETETDRARLNAEVTAKMTAEDIVGYETMLRGSPDDVELHDDVALLYLAAGRTDLAVEHFTASAKLEPDSAQAHFNLGTALTLAGDFDRAIAEYQRALALNSNYTKAMSNLGDALAAQGRVAEAVPHYLQAIERDPTMAVPHNNLGAALIANGDVAGAGVHFAQALRIDPAYGEARYGLGRVHRRQGALGDAARELRQAVVLKPGWAPPLIELAWVLATAPDAAVRDEAEALRCAEQAVTLTGGRNASALDALGAAHANAGHFAAAMSAARDAKRLTSDRSLIAEIDRRITLYEQEQPYRDRGRNETGFRFR